MNINSCRWSNFSMYKITMGANPVVNRISPFDELSALAIDNNIVVSRGGEFRRFAPLFALDQLQRGLDIDIIVKQEMTALQIGDLSRRSHELFGSSLFKEISSQFLDLKKLQLLIHDLKSPLFSITGFVDLILLELEKTGRDDLGEEKGFLQAICASAERFLDMVNNFLLFTKNTQGFVDVRGLIENFKLLNHLQLAAVGELETAEDQTLQAKFPKIYGNPSEINSMLENLLFNSICAIQSKIDAGGLKKGDGIIKVSFSTARREDINRLIIKIADNGCGMSQENQEKALRGYFSTKEYGSGIGLITVARTVEKLDGIVTFSSTEGVGTEFTMDIPCTFDF